MKTRTTWLLY